MTPRENFWRMMHRDDPHWLPMELPMTPPVQDLMEQMLGTRDAHTAFGVDLGVVWAEFPNHSDRWRQAFANLGVTLPDNCWVGGFGEAARIPSRASVGSAYHLTEKVYPLSVITEEKQLQFLPWPDISQPTNVVALTRRVQEIHEHEERAALGTQECTAFEMAWYVRGMDAIYIDLVEGNGIADWLLDYFTQRSMAAVRALARAGVDVIGLGDDVGTQRGMMMSVPFWRTHLKGRLQRVIDAVRAERGRDIIIKYHSDGNIMDIVPDLIEIGVDMLNPVQPECMSADDLARRFGSELGLWGMVGTQTTMPFGSPRDVAAVVRQCADIARQGVPVVVAPTHVLEPDVPWENITALVQSVRAIRLDGVVPVASKERR